MIICTNCESPVDDGLDVCPYCETPFESSTPAPRTTRRSQAQDVVTINLKKGNPVSEIALDRLKMAIASYQPPRTQALKLIHGYGSKGLGGIIRNVIREQLENLRYNREIRDFIPGEELGRVDLSRLPSAYRPGPEDINNYGITIVVL